jgi:hypothetical protein
MAVKTLIVFFWVVTPCSPVESFQRFEGIIASIFIYTEDGAGSSEKLVTAYKTTRRHNPEDHNP